MTIEERAKQLYREDIGVWTKAGAEYLQKTYIRGCTDQTALMLDRLKEFMNVLMLDTSSKERLYKYLAEE